MDWEEKCECTNCNIVFVSDTPDAYCPKCGSMRFLIDTIKEVNYP